MTEYLRPNGDISIGGWTDQAGGTSNLYTAIDEASPNNADFIKSMINPVNDRIKMAVSDPTGLIATATRRVRLGKGVNNATVVNIRLALMQGSTEIATWDYNDVTYGGTDYEVVLTAPQLAAITAPNNLEWWITANPAATGWNWSASMTPKLLAWGDAYHVTTSGANVTQVDNRQGSYNWIPLLSGTATITLQPTGWAGTYADPASPCLRFLGDSTSEACALVNSNFITNPNGNYWSVWYSGHLLAGEPHLNRIISMTRSGGFGDFDSDTGFLANTAEGSLAYHAGDIDVSTQNIVHGRPHRLGLSWNDSMISLWDNGMLAQGHTSVPNNPATPTTPPWDLASTLKFGIYGRPDTGGGGVGELWRAFVATHGNAGDLTKDDILEIDLYLQYPNGLPTISDPQAILGTDLITWIDPNLSLHTFTTGAAIATVTGLEPAATVFNGMSAVPPERLANQFGTGHYGWRNDSARGNNYAATLEASIATGGISRMPLMGGVAMAKATAAEFNWNVLQMFDSMWALEITPAPSNRAFGIISAGSSEQFKQWVTPNARFRYITWYDATNLNFLINGKYFSIAHTRLALPALATARWGGQGPSGNGEYEKASFGVAFWGRADNITDAKIAALDLYLATWAKNF